MTGNRAYFINYKSCSEGHVTFGDGERSRVVGNGTLNVDGLPSLNNVLHVEGLKANVISISQLCDQNLYVQFIRDKCHLYNEVDKCVMTGLRSSDNYYLLQEFQVHYRSTVDETKVWH